MVSLSICFLIFVFIISFFILVKGSDIFIDGASAIALRKGVSEHMIGLTLVAFATSIPELAVSDIAAYQGAEGIAIGNVIGSNIANIGIVLGIAILIMPLQSSKQSMHDGIFLLGITALLILLILDGTLSRVDGFIFLMVYIVFFFILIKRYSTKGQPIPEELMETMGSLEKESEIKDWIMVGGGAAMVLLGAHFLVESAVEMADKMNVSSFIIGLTIVSIGTSLPELASSVAAALKKKHGISIGNVIGSNMINILLVLGTAALINPIRADNGGMAVSIPFLILFTVLCMMFLLKRELPRWGGILLLSFYVVFLVFLIFAGGL